MDNAERKRIRANIRQMADEALLRHIDEIVASPPSEAGQHAAAILEDMRFRPAAFWDTKRERNLLGLIERDAPGSVLRPAIAKRYGKSIAEVEDMTPWELAVAAACMLAAEEGREPAGVVGARCPRAQRVRDGHASPAGRAVVCVGGRHGAPLPEGAMQVSRVCNGTNGLDGQPRPRVATVKPKRPGAPLQAEGGAT